MSKKLIRSRRLSALALARSATIEGLESRMMLTAVTTGAAVSISATGVTLDATVNPQGGSTTAQFQVSANPSIAPSVVNTLIPIIAYPAGLATDAAGDVFVPDFNANDVQEILPSGTIKTLGSGFFAPGAVAVDSTGDVFVADTFNNAVKEILPNGTINTLGSGFNEPDGVAVDGTGDVFVADYGNNAVKEILPTGTIKTVATGFNQLASVELDAKGDLFIADAGNNAIKEILPNGTIKTLGSGFSNPQDTATDAAGDVFVADTGNNAIKEILPNGTIKTLGSGFLFPGGVAVNAAGDVFVSDGYNSAVKEILPSGTIKTLASGFLEPNGLAPNPTGDIVIDDDLNGTVVEMQPNGISTVLASGFKDPQSIAMNAAGDVFVADTGDNAVKEILPNGTVETLGSGFNAPTAVAVNAAGDVFVADTGNNAIKEILPGGTIKVLGSGFKGPTGVAVDAAGDVYVADNGNNLVKEILSNGTIKTVVSTITGPYSVALDTIGDLYITGISPNFVAELLPDGSVVDILTYGDTTTQGLGIAVDQLNDIFVTTSVFKGGIYEASPRSFAATPSPLTGSTATAVSTTLTGLLTPGTTYYYRVVTTNADGTSVVGAIKSFTTVATGSISGTTFTDTSGNGLNSTNTILPGVKVNLYTDTAGTGIFSSADKLLQTVTTGSTGTYSFSKLAADYYIVTETTPTGDLITGPSPLTYYPVDLTRDGQVTADNFANFQEPTNLGLSNVTYTIGSHTYSSLGGHTLNGETVSVTFTVTNPAGEYLSLVQYTATTSTFAAATASQQKVFQSVAALYTAGTHTISITLPKTGFYQLDFVEGAVISQFGAVGSNLFYAAQDRLISSDNK